MAYRVEWSPRAIEDLEAIAQHIALDSTAYSSAVVKTILQTTRKFSSFPFSESSIDLMRASSPLRLLSMANAY